MPFAVCCAAILVQPPVAYEFVPDTTRSVMIMRDRIEVYGWLDSDGEFNESSRRQPGFYSGRRHLLNFGAEGEVYEYRSGMLIPGTQRPMGKFIPTPGGRIVRFADYRYSPTATPIWNLPGYFRPVSLIPSAPQKAVHPSESFNPRL